MADQKTDLYIRNEANDGWWIIGGERVRQNASFVTVVPEADLGAYRTITAGNSITISDGGPASTVTVALATPGTLTVSTSNAAVAPHTHAITSSSNPGAAASLLASSAAGELTLVGLTLSGLTASTVVYANGSKKFTSLANAAGYLTNNGTGTLSWSAGATPSAHDILSTSHGDTLAASVVAGDVMIGNATPKWSRLARSVPAANVRNVFGLDNGDTLPAWKTALDATNPTTLTVSLAAGPGTSLVFSHRDHAHAITSSSNPGAAASLLASSAAGELTLVGITLSGLTASTVIYSDAAKKIVSLANAAGYLYNNGAGALSWTASVTPSAHNVLSATHSDTLADSVVAGDVIIGNATPKWSRLARSVPAANVRNVFGLDNGDTLPAWKTALDATAPATLTVSAAAAAGTSLVFSHRDHVHPITTSSDPGAAASILASSAAGFVALEGIGIIDGVPQAHTPFKIVFTSAAAATYPVGQWTELTTGYTGVAFNEIWGHYTLVKYTDTQTHTGGVYGHTIIAKNMNGSGDVDYFHGIRVILQSEASGGTVTSGYYIRMTDGGGADHFANVYGLYIADLTGATVSNYAIYTNAGLVRFGDDVSLASGKGLIHADGVSDGSVLVANGTRYIPGNISDITGGDASFVTIAASATLANERVLTAGDGIDLTDGGAGGNATVAVDVTDILGSGLTEAANNIALDWGAPTIGTIECDDAADAGVSTNPARSDHQHAIACAAPSTSLSSITTNAEGTATSFARSDHTHAISGIAYDDNFITVPLEPAQLTASQNNYNPGDDTFVRLTADADGYTITGWQNGTSGKWKIVYNASTTGRNITFAHESASSTDVNRFYMGGLANIDLPPLSTLWFIWHANRWRQVISPALA